MTYKVFIRIIIVLILLLQRSDSYGFNDSAKKPAFSYSIAGASTSTKENILQYTSSLILQPGDYWEAVNGTIISSKSSVVIIHWTTSGSGSVNIKNSLSQIVATFPVTVNT